MTTIYICPLPTCHKDTAAQHFVVPADHAAQPGRIRNLYPCRLHAGEIATDPVGYAKKLDDYLEKLRAKQVKNGKDK